MRIPGLIAALALAAAAAAARAGGFAGCGGQAPAPPGEALALDALGPGPAPVDAFHPDNAPDARGARPPQPAKAYGGSVTLHLDVLPPSLCYPLEGSADVRRILYEVHETLMRQDWESWEWLPALARERVVEDTLVLADGSRLWGAVAEDGDGWVVTPRAATNPLAEARRVPKDAVRSLERATVYTYVLRDDVRWHPVEGIAEQRLDARDVAFSFSIYKNPHVRCDERRYQFEEVECTVLDERTLRFAYPRQTFRGDQAIADMTILPSHLYDLADPDNKDHDPAATPEAQARYIHESAHNRLWVGLGPYRVTAFGPQEIVAERFAGYYDPADGGYVDTIRWRAVGDAAAFQALLEGELDFTPRLASDDYFGRAAEPPFSERYYRGHFVRSMYTSVIWNLRRPELADPAVRRAIALAFDAEGFLRGYYKLAYRVSGPMPFFSPAYDRAVEPWPHDPARAERLLDEAGWYDRDGDGVRDKDGVALALEYLMPSGSTTSRTLGLKLQEDLAAIGIAVALRELEWAAYLERQKQREFAAMAMAWYQPLEPDPEQVWHSRSQAGSNHSGLADAEVDRLIELGQREPDGKARAEIWRALHRRLHELQPCLFLYNVPVRFALRRGLRGFQAFGIDPGYAVRRWYWPEGTPGTRRTR